MKGCITGFVVENPFAFIFSMTPKSPINLRGEMEGFEVDNGRGGGSVGAGVGGDEDVRDEVDYYGDNVGG